MVLLHICPAVRRMYLLLAGGGVCCLSFVELAFDLRGQLHSLLKVAVGVIGLS